MRTHVLRLFTGFSVEGKLLAFCKQFKDLNQNTKGWRWIPFKNLHVTSCFIGEVPGDQAAHISRVIQHIASETDTFELVVKEICLWPSKRARMIWILFEENELFTRLQHRLEKTLLQKIEREKVYPHITLARNKLRIINTPVFPSSIPELKLPVERMILFESKRLQQGVNYQAINQFHLSS
ncbi:MAG: RNA 2',3'-cyclic phosphodiesterase [Bacteroidales bacterium]|nr:RNA 2',3'-cyclic phosphodiesterase [Bacteroidales bacterium]